MNRSLRSRLQVGWFVLAIAAFGAGDAADGARPAQAEHGRESFVKEFKLLALGKILMARFQAGKLSMYAASCEPVRNAPCFADFFPQSASDE